MNAADSMDLETQLAAFNAWATAAIRRLNGQSPSAYRLLVVHRFCTDPRFLSQALHAIADHDAAAALQRFDRTPPEQQDLS